MSKINVNNQPSQLRTVANSFGVVNVPVTAGGVPLWVNQLAALNPQVGSYYVRIIPQGGAIYFRDDGTIPTAAAGGGEYIASGQYYTMRWEDAKNCLMISPSGTIPVVFKMQYHEPTN